MEDYERLGYQRYAEENRDEVELMKKKAFDGAELIIQCEQSVDHIVLPDRNGCHPLVDCFLQDNFQDWIAFIVGTHHAAKVNIPMIVIRTSTDLDMGKGIGSNASNISST